MVGATMRSTIPRPFLLVRFRDVSAVSGTGVVAEGTEWTDGSASLRWRGEYPTTTFFETGVRAIVAVHGHSGGTEVVFAGDPAPQRLLGDFEYPDASGLRVPTASQDGLCVGCGAAWPCTRCTNWLTELLP